MNNLLPVTPDLGGTLAAFIKVTWLYTLAFVPAIGGLYLYLHRAPALTERDLVLIADFVNTTGEPLFDGTLKQALAVKLEESPYLNVFPDERVSLTLRSMGRSPEERVTGPLAREICERRGLKALVAGSIATFGTQYVVALNATNCATGEVIARAQIEAARKEDVLRGLGQAAIELRGKLGESLASIEQYSHPVEEATTASLEALKAYKLAMESRDRDPRAAVPLFKRAIELDPNFALAYARLGVLYSNQGEQALAAEHLKKAFELRDRVSEPERLYLTAHYHRRVKGDIPKTIETYTVWKQTYPRDFTPYNNLAVLYSSTGETEKRLAEAQEGLRLNPDSVLPYGAVASAYQDLNRLDEAKVIDEQSIARGRDTDGTYGGLYTIAFLQNDTGGMQKALAVMRQRQPDQGTVWRWRWPCDAAG
jgi:tetratricopeptide (TPR) repeat protein